MFVYPLRFDHEFFTSCYFSNEDGRFFAAQTRTHWYPTTECYQLDPFKRPGERGSHAPFLSKRWRGQERRHGPAPPSPPICRKASSGGPISILRGSGRERKRHIVGWSYKEICEFDLAIIHFRGWQLISYIQCLAYFL